MRTDSHSAVLPTRRACHAALLLLAGLALLAGHPAHAQPGASGSATLRIVVSIHPYADLARQIVGDDAEVLTLLPAGASPHAYDPSPSQATALARADVVVMNGGIDAWLERLIDAAAPAAARLVILDAIAFDPVETADDHEQGAGGASDGASPPTDGAAASSDAGHLFVNPHVWLDPTLAAKAVVAMATVFGQAAPQHAAAFQQRAAALEADLAALDRDVAEILRPVAGAAFVPFHDAWPYFARRYGLEIVATLEPFPGREPSPRYVADAVAAVRAAGAKAVFGERQLNPRPAEVVAESAGVALVVLDPIGGAPGVERFQDLLRDNALRIATALGATDANSP